MWKFLEQVNVKNEIIVVVRPKTIDFKKIYGIIKADILDGRR